MVGYYPSRSQRSIMNEMPPTPPGSGSGFGYNSMPYASDSYGPQHNLASMHLDSAYDFQHNYARSAGGPTPSTYAYPQAGYQNVHNLPPIQTNYYEPGAPILPPLRMHGQPTSHATDPQRSFQVDQQTLFAREQQQQAQQPVSQPGGKEEKSSGGVSAKLDYDMDRMTDFVTQATQSIFRHNALHPGFRKWIHQVLSATRLPSATILLSLHYLNDRVENHPHTVERNDENRFYRLLAVSLILGSKFLDDNTFINRSWSDVTSIKVIELNNLEMKWLHLINYQLHVDPSGGLSGWIDAWKKYDADYVVKQQQQQQQATRLSPLTTGLRHHTSSQDLRYSPYSATMSATSGRSYAHSGSARSSHFSSPYVNESWSAPSQRTNVDDYRKPYVAAYPSYSELEEVARRASEDRARQSTAAAYAYSQPAQTPYYAGPSPYASAWDQSAWGGAHRFDCGCATCAYQQHYRTYPMASSYASQTVVG